MFKGIPETLKAIQSSHSELFDPDLFKCDEDIQEVNK